MTVAAVSAAPVQLRLLTAHDRVEPVDKGEVISWAAAHVVGPTFSCHEPVGPGAAAEAITTRAAPDGVGAVASLQRIVAPAAPDGVGARASPDLVAICAAPDGVGAALPAEAVAARLALDHVAAAAGVDVVPAMRAVQALALGGSLLGEPASGERRGRGPGQDGLATQRDRHEHGRTGHGCQDHELAEHKHHLTRP
jgi:hypothetical protein